MLGGYPQEACLGLFVLFFLGGSCFLRETGGADLGERGDGEELGGQEEGKLW